MALMTLRLKTKTGQQVLKDLMSDTNVLRFKQKLSEVTGIAPTHLKLMMGFPPKAVDLCDNEKSIGSIFRSGDVLIVQEASGICTTNESTSDKILRQVVPANNSCLFTSVNFCVESKSAVDLNCSTAMRNIIATVVRSDPEHYSSGFLEKSNDAYCNWILNEESWGGAIEISILSNYFDVEIAVVDTETVRIDRFGEDKHYSKRILLIYDGIHYDALYRKRINGTIQTVFPATDDSVLVEALKLAEEAKASRQFTNLQKFSIRCLVCNQLFSGQVKASEHANETGHINFGEI